MNILMVTTSADRLPAGHPTGLWLEEFAVPYDYFVGHGATVTVASPRGGRVPLDPKTEPSDRQRIDWHGALQALSDSLPLRTIDETPFDGLFIPGGHGPIVDLVEDTDLQDLVAAFFDEGKLIGAVCHGPAALLDVRGPDGHFLVRDKEITGFSNLEERLAGMHGKVPLLLEAELERRGARYSRSLIPMTAHVVRDGGIVTGQNPASTHKVTEEFHEGLRQNIELFTQLGIATARGARGASAGRGGGGWRSAH